MGRPRKIKFTTQRAIEDWISATEDAIQNMIEEIKKKPDQELSGSQRKNDLAAIKETAINCKELITEREKMERMLKELEDTGEIGEEKDWSGGWAEKHASR